MLHVLYELSFWEWGLVWIVLFILAALGLAHFAKGNDLDLTQLLVNPDTGKLDKLAFLGMMGACFFSWAFVFYVAKEKADAFLFMIYGTIMMFPKAYNEIAKSAILAKLGGLPQQSAAPGASNDSTKTQ